MLRGTFQNADGFVARTQQRNAAGFVFFQEIEQVGEGALGGVRGRHGNEELAAQSSIEGRQDRRPRGRDRLVKCVEAAPLAQALDDAGDGLGALQGVDQPPRERFPGG